LEFASLFDCGIVISMLPDHAAVRDVALGREEAKGLASGLKDGAIHLSMSTISTATASRLAAEHARYGQSYSPRQSSEILTPPGPVTCSLWPLALQPMSSAVSRYSTASGKRHLSSAPILRRQTLAT
jgi:hypothetical protein